MIVVIMGVAGSGKSTVGRLLAQALDCPFLEGDTLHPPSNIEKMSSGQPLTDADRAPWLAAVHARIMQFAASGQSLVVACSALKQAYRDQLQAAVDNLRWVFLTGPEAVLRQRLEHRKGHFFKADLLASQLADLEPPTNAIVADIRRPPAVLAQQIRAAL